ncbi:MAG: NAD(P)-binding domain-containing protein, partial [Nitrososphaerales archaeon]
MTQLGFLGGTGDLGKALVIHLARNYDKVLLGSREKQKAEHTIKELQSNKAGREYLKDKLVPATNEEVAKKSDIIIATLPAKHAVQSIKEL